MNINKLSHSEKILLVEQLWDSIRAEAETSPLTETQKAELDRRLADYELNPDEGDSWSIVKARILNQ
jgi:putative addiction module component (TIGR02574 family)